jgi:hypothetical protein
MKAMFKSACFVGLLMAYSTMMSAQHLPVGISQAHFSTLQKLEDSLQILSDSTIQGKQDVVRQTSCYTFIKKFVAALNTPQSYLYTFDSLKSISVCYAPDNQFRIFTWYVLRSNGTYRYFGVIQKNNKSKLEIYPLFDLSPLIRSKDDTICNQDSWYGCLYYNMTSKIINGKPYYFLMGWKGKNTREVEKIIEPLSFDNNKKPVFGAPLLYKKMTNGREQQMARFRMGYNKEASVTLNYDELTDQIIFDHLVNNAVLKNNKDASIDIKIKDYNYVPDGGLEAFVWRNSRWEWVPSLENVPYKEAPRPSPVFDK